MPLGGSMSMLWRPSAEPGHGMGARTGPIEVVPFPVCPSRFVCSRLFLRSSSDWHSRDPRALARDGLFWGRKWFGILFCDRYAIAITHGSS